MTKTEELLNVIHKQGNYKGIDNFSDFSPEALDNIIKRIQTLLKNAKHE